MMKKYIFLLVILCGFLVSGCKKDKDNNGEINQITGYWDRRVINPATQNYLVEQFQFNTDGSFKHAYTVHDKASFSLLGYSEISTGKFKLEDNTITLYNTEGYSKNSTEEYVPQSSLVKVQSVDRAVGYSIDNKKGTLSLTYYCGPAAYCIGNTATFNKSMGIDASK